MESLSALLVLIACDPNGVSCIKEPVAVVSYQTDDGCLDALPRQVADAQRSGWVVYGDCVPVLRELAAGQIDRRTDPGARPLVSHDMVAIAAR